MMTRIRVVKAHRSIGDWVEVTEYEVLCGNLRTLPQDVLAQSETTGTIWGIHQGKIPARMSDGGAVSALAPLSLTTLLAGRRISKGEVLRIALFPPSERDNEQIGDRVGVIGASEGRSSERHHAGYFQCPHLPPVRKGKATQ